MTEDKSPPWNLCRFLQTLAYFGVIPFLGSLGWLQGLFGVQTKNNDAMSNNKAEVILVVGATGGVGKRVVRRLLDRGDRVRALVRDAKKAREILGDKVEIVEADIAIPATLTTAVTDNIKAVICCSGTRVQPVEGDTPTREKYYQGIKFYLPEVVDIPEIVEYQGIVNLIQATRDQLIATGAEQGKILMDFGQIARDIKDTWGALDDIVMGGVSESEMRLVGNTAVFSGKVSTANSGGFASVRTRNLEPILNLSGYNGIELRVKGDGKRYKFILRNADQWDSIAYSYSFDTIRDTWINVRVPFDALIPAFRAKVVETASKFDPSKIYSLQLMLSKFEYDRDLNPNFTPGLFALEIASMKAYGNQKLPQFIHISSAGVTRPSRPGINLEEEPPAVKLNDQLGGILTWKLRGEEVIRSSEIPYTIIRPCALTEEPGGQALKFEQGDNIRGKVSREAIAEICIHALEEPKAVNVTFEVKESDDEGKRNWETLFSSLQSDR